MLFQRLADSVKRSRIVAEKGNIIKFCPIKRAYIAYAINKVQFKDPKSGKTYIDAWERNTRDIEKVSFYCYACVTITYF